MIVLNIAGLDEIRQTFSTLVPEVKKQVINGLAQVAFDTAQTQVDTHTQTGALARSLSIKLKGDDAWIIGHDLQHAPYAGFVHWGWKRTAPIYPKERKTLRWVSGQGGGTHYVFARFVKTPASYAGDPWLVKAADEAIRQFDEIVRSVQAR
jgi:hypothetical protein